MCLLAAFYTVENTVSGLSISRCTPSGWMPWSSIFQLICQRLKRQIDDSCISTKKPRSFVLFWLDTLAQFEVSVLMSAECKSYFLKIFWRSKKCVSKTPQNQADTSNCAKVPTSHSSLSAFHFSPYHSSLLTHPLSLFTLSLLTSHSSLFTFHYPLIPSHSSLLTHPFSLFTLHFSLFTFFCWLLILYIHLWY